MDKPRYLGAANVWKILILFTAACALAVFLSGCKTAPVEPAEPLPVEPPPCPDMTVRELERQAIELLDQGDSEQARFLLNCALQEDPRSSRSKDLIDQLDADPVEQLGSKYYLHTVESSETLSKIAQDRLGSGLQFVILARYNDITVPANLVAGQRIKIPGNEPDPDYSVPVQNAQPQAAHKEPATPADEPPSVSLREDALEMEQKGDLDEAYAMLKKAQAADPSLPAIEDDLARVRAALTAGLEEEAYRDELEGNPEKAIETWRKLLEVDPGNIPAQLSIRRLSR